MNFSLMNAKVSFLDQLTKHNSFYALDNVDPEILAESRLFLIREAKKSYEIKDSPEAIYWYGRCLATGEEAFPIDMKEAIKYLNQAVMMRHHSACVTLGDIYSSEIANVPNEISDMDKAIKNYVVASDRGDGYSSFRLASIYSGELGYKNDLRNALDYLDKSVEQESEDGLCLKAYWIYQGDFMDKDLEEIFKITEQIIERSEDPNFISFDALAKIFFLYGHLLYNGEGIQEDKEEAVCYIEEAANYGDLNAIQWLRDYNLEHA